MKIKQRKNVAYALTLVELFGQRRKNKNRKVKMALKDSQIRDVDRK